jgi:protein-S-isoprenylcysteine O-methyltransferase Ste14
MGPHWFHHPIMIIMWYATFALWSIPEIILSRRRPGLDARKDDRRSKIIVIMAVNLGIFLGFSAATQVPRLSIEAHWEALFATGIAVWLGGILFRWYSILTLGRFFTFEVALSMGQQVVERGPYRWLRHPSYTGSLLTMFGFGMTFANWLALILPVCCLVAAYVYRIPIEERALERGLGSSYSDYMRRTWRLIPYLF